MPTPPQDGKLLYHITAIDNLENIFQHGLLSRKDIEIKRILQKDVADDKIIQKRKELAIDCYIPFHFFEPTPFTGRILQTHTNIDFCFIAITREFPKNKKSQICTAHPLSQNPPAEIKPYDLQSIDWESMNKRDYGDERIKNICMAEALIEPPITHKDFRYIYVADEKDEIKIRNLAKRIIGDNYGLSITVNPHFFKNRQ